MIYNGGLDNNEGSDLMAVATARISNKSGYISTLGVDPKERRKGMGTYILKVRPLKY